MQKVAIFGVPRSGTSWLAHIFNSHPDVALRFQPLFSYGHKGALSSSSSATEIRAFFDDILHSTDEFATMKAEMQKDYPVFDKSPQPTHIVFKETRYLNLIGNMLRQCPEIRIVGIVRNPLAVLASWISAPREFDRQWDVSAEWRTAPGKNRGRPEEFYGFDKWKEFTANCLSYSEQFPRQFLLLRYDRLNQSPLPTTQSAFAFCGLKVCKQVRDFLAASKSRHDPNPYSVYRGAASDDRWQEILADDIVSEVITELDGTPLADFLGASGC